MRQRVRVNPDRGVGICTGQRDRTATLRPNQTGQDRPARPGRTVTKMLFVAVPANEGLRFRSPRSHLFVSLFVPARRQFGVWWVLRQASRQRSRKEARADGAYHKDASEHDPDWGYA